MHIFLNLITFIAALHIKTQICAWMPIPKGRLTVFTNYPSVTKDQALEETVLTLFHPVVYSCFQAVCIRIQLPIMMLLNDS